MEKQSSQASKDSTATCSYKWAHRSWAQVERSCFEPSSLRANTCAFGGENPTAFRSTCAPEQAEVSYFELRMHLIPGRAKKHSNPIIVIKSPEELKLESKSFKNLGLVCSEITQALSCLEPLNTPSNDFWKGCQLALVRICNSTIS